jgi:hypothetical protein
LRLAVSDSLHGLLAALTLPDLDVSVKSRVPFHPGKMVAGARLYCADVSEPAVYAFDIHTLEHLLTFPAAPEIEALSLSPNGMYLYALAGGADSLQMLDAGQGRLLNIVKAGMHPRAIAQDARCAHIAVAGGATGEVTILDSQTLRVLDVYQADGIACDCCFFAGQLMILCMAGEYDVGTIVGAISPSGKWTPWVKLPGLPGAMTPCGGGLLVGHLHGLTMLDAPGGKIRWQTKISGLASAIVPAGRAACFMDSLEGMIGLIEFRHGAILRRLNVGEPGGITVV